MQDALTTGAPRSIDTLAALTAEQFQVRYLRRGQPVIVTGDPAAAIAVRDWNFERLASCHPHHPVDVEYYASGDRSRYWIYRRMALQEYLTLIREHPEARQHYYLAEKPLTEVLPQLAADLSTPSLLQGAELTDVVVFIGIDTFTTAHYHSTPTEALLTQIHGRKRLILYPPRRLSLLRPHRWYSMRSNWSSIPMRDDTDARLDSPDCFECTLAPGDALFIPQGWLHAAQGLSESVSVTHFFKGSWRHARPRVALRDLASKLEQRYVLMPLTRYLARRRNGLRHLLSAAVSLGIVPRCDRDAWASRFGIAPPSQD